MNNMKKIIFIVSINLIFIFGVLILFDWFFLSADTYKPTKFPLNWTIGITERFQNDLPFDKNKSEILTIGDSFVIGTGIGSRETLAYKLQQYTGHKTYNYGMAGQGIQHVLYKLQYSPYLRELFQGENKNPEYIIFVFISDHMRRMYCNYLVQSDKAKYLKYKQVNKDNLALVPEDVRKIDYIKITHLAKRFNNLMYQLKSPDTAFNLFKLYMKEIKSVLNEKYPKSKFVIIVYNADIVDTHGVKNFHTNRWNEIEEMGYTVINFDTEEYRFLTGEEYRAFDRVHPSGLAWEKLVPIISRKLNL